MSTNEDFNLDLENLFQPAWAQEKIEQNLIKKFGDREERPNRHFGESRGEQRGRGPRRDERRGNGPSRDRKAGGRPGPGGRDRGDRRGRHGEERREPRREQPVPLPELEVTFLPQEKSIEQLAHQVKTTGRAYPLFNVAQLLLDKVDCYSVKLAPKKDTKTPQPLFLCALDNTPWLTENEAIAHVLKGHLPTFYQAERVPTDPPKGIYNFVAQCGISGVVLGPPNYHDYQNQLRRLHTERFQQMPFETFKSRIKIVKDEAVIKQWLEEQSFKTEYNCLNVAEPLRLTSMEEVEKHFRTAHKESIITQVTTCTLPGAESRRLPHNGGLYLLIRKEWEQLKRFPLPFAAKLSQQLAHHGLQFFKVNKTITHVNVARPKYLDLEATPVSDSIKRIVEFINATPKCTRKKLVEALAPTPKAEPMHIAEPTPPPSESNPTDTTTGSAEAPAAPAPVEKPVTVHELTEQQKAVMTDLHWLIHQGFVLEFANGKMETAKKPAQPVKKAQPEAPKAAEETEAPAPQAAEPEQTSSETTPQNPEQTQEEESL